jgi:hypothetical protein
VHTWVVLKMSKAEQAAFFNSAIGACIAASFTTDKMREPSCVFSLQLIPGRSITLVLAVFELLPFDFGGIGEEY